MREKEKLVAGLDFKRMSIAIEMEMEGGLNKEKQSEKERE